MAGLEGLDHMWITSFLSCVSTKGHLDPRPWPRSRVAIEAWWLGDWELDLVSRLAA